MSKLLVARRAALLFCLFLAIPGALTAQASAREGIVRGEGWAFMIQSPEGWTWDRRSLYREGVEALFYQEGNRFDLGKPFMYIDPSSAFWAVSGGTAPAGRAETASLQEVLLYELDSGGGALSLVGLFEERGRRFAFVLSAPSREALESTRAAFLELISSFVLLEEDKAPEAEPVDAESGATS